ncbi:ankyrin repeat and SOCS box protein 2-like [Haliotis cracherodii]|uniref:ankyrin repeat and SOCS box protein 2-like n=1 Tax=Haliotis cracherodii TaxID=6455 RepID=UPI0039EA125D
MECTKKSTNPRQNSRVLPLHHYAYKNDIEAIRKALANSSTDICAKDMSGRTALFVATCFSRVEIARMLLALGCDPNIANNDGDTPLHEATEKSSLPMVQLLLKSGKCKLDAKNRDGQTPLMKAAFFDYLDIMKCLHLKGASIDAKDARGKTALFYALDEGSEKTAIYLMKNKCDVNVMDNGGHSALYEAIHSQFFHSTECLLLLESSGYDFKKDSVWLEKEEKSSKFYKLDDAYHRFLKSAGVSRNTGDLVVPLEYNNDPWRIPYTVVLGSTSHTTSPKPARATTRNTLRPVV